MRDVVTKYRRLSLAGRKPRISPWIDIRAVCQSAHHVTLIKRRLGNSFWWIINCMLQRGKWEA